MAKIKRSGFSPEYLDMRTETIQRGERNDCTVIATAFAFGLDYDTAHAELAALGRTPGKGVYYSFFGVERIANKYGYRIERLNLGERIASYPGRAAALKNVTTHHPDRFPAAWRDGQTYLLFTAGHVLCVKNGRVLDWARGRALRVMFGYRVVRAEA